MTPKAAVKHYDTQVALAAALDLTQPCVANWVSRGKIPVLQQLRIEAITGGALRADRRGLPRELRRRQ